MLLVQALFCAAPAQGEGPVYRNLFTFNIISFPGLQYEHFISQRQSFGIGATANYFPLATGALHFTADYRFHIRPRREGIYNDTRDSFFGPFIKYSNRENSFLSELALDLDHQLGFGIFFGIQKISEKGFVMCILGGIGPSIFMVDKGYKETWLDDPSSMLYRLSLFIGFAR